MPRPGSPVTFGCRAVMHGVAAGPSTQAESADWAASEAPAGLGVAWPGPDYIADSDFKLALPGGTRLLLSEFAESCREPAARGPAGLTDSCTGRPGRVGRAAYSVWMSVPTVRKARSRRT